MQENYWFELRKNWICYIAVAAGQKKTQKSIDFFPVVFARVVFRGQWSKVAVVSFINQEASNWLKFWLKKFRQLFCVNVHRSQIVVTMFISSRIIDFSDYFLLEFKLWNFDLHPLALIGQT